jgi:hypothetical protein
MDLTADERALLLAGLFELTAGGSGDQELRDRARALAAKLGGDPEAPAFAVAVLDETAARAALLPTLDDEPDGVYFPRASGDHVDDDLPDPELARLLADCVSRGEHHLAALDHPEEGMVIGCTHCHRFWRDPDPAEE